MVASVRPALRVSTRVAILALPLTLLLPAMALAQPGPPPAQTERNADPQTEQADPPDRVGRVARVQGDVSFRLPGEDEWQPASINLPVIEGNGVFAGPGGRALLEVGESRIALESGTDLQIATLDEATLSATMPSGAVYLSLAGLAPDERAELVTPQGSVAMALDGRYLVEAPLDRPLRVTVFEGEALVATASGETRLRSGQVATFGDAAPRIERAGAGTPLVAWAEGAVPKPRVPQPVATRGMTGAADLARYGRWERSQEHGEVWYPTAVAQDWAPYRDGKWRWVEPWGWTWVDEQPWGYAPSHYGRWVQVGPRWAWAPAAVAIVVGAPRPRPVWAPAVVRFFGGGGGPRGTVPVGWIPLAPREPYYPWYRASPRYVERVNYRQFTDYAPVRAAWQQHGRDPRNAWRDRPFEEMRNRRYATVVPADALIGSRPIRAEYGRLRIEDQRRAYLVQEGPPRPGIRTAGLSPVVARRLGIEGDSGRRDGIRQGPPRAAHVALREAPDRWRRDGGDRREDRRDDRRDAVEQRQDAARDRAADQRRDAAEDRQDAQRDRAADRRRDGNEDRQDSVRDRAAEQRRDAAEQRQDAVRDRAAEQRRDAADDRQDAARDRAAEQRRDAADQQRQGTPREGAAERRRDAAEDRQDAARERAAEQRRESADQRQDRATDQRRDAAEQRQEDAADRAAAEARRRAAEQQRGAGAARRDVDGKPDAASAAGGRAGGDAAAEAQRRAAEQQRQGAQQQRAADQQRRAAEQQRRAAEQRGRGQDGDARGPAEEPRQAPEGRRGAERQQDQQERQAAQQAQQQRRAADQQARQAGQQQQQAEQARRATEQQQRQGAQQQQQAEQQQRQAAQQQRQAAQQQQQQRQAGQQEQQQRQAAQQAEQQQRQAAQQQQQAAQQNRQAAQQAAQQQREAAQQQRQAERAERQQR